MGARNTSIPRIMSTTRRILRGEVGTFRNFAKYMIRGMEVFRALGVLKFSNKEAAARVEKLLRSAIANWEQKNERKAEAGELCVSSISVDCATTLKRMRPAPQGRGYRIRKRSNHVTLFVDTLSKNDSQN